MENFVSSLPDALQFGKATVPVLVAGSVAAACIVDKYLFKSKNESDKYALQEEEAKSKDLKTKVVGKKTEPTLEDIPVLVSEMRDSFNSGISLPISKRLQQLKALRRLVVENEDKIVQVLKEDLGRPTFEALFYDFAIVRAEIDHMIHNLDALTAPEAQAFNILAYPSRQYLFKEPYGLVLVIGTWNYPVMLSLIPLAGAIAAGNCAILKPCNVSKKTAELMAELIPKYMDPRIVSVVGTAMEGDRSCTGALLEHKFDLIFFTGSPSVGRVIMQGAAKYLTPVILELGGKNPVFVHSDADVTMAAKRTVWGRMMNCGQQCISPDYVLCNKDVVDKFCSEAVRFAKELYGDDTETNGNLGKIVGDKQMERLIKMLESSGGEILCGGKFNKETRHFEPTVVKVPFSSPALEDETFGPILWVVSVDDIDSSIKYVNSKPKPLSLYIFSSSQDVEKKIVCNTSSGGVTVNGTLFHAGHPSLPFGGVGDSGCGAYHGDQTFYCFTHKKPVLVKTKLPDFGLLSDPFFLYPPWTDLKIKALRALSYLI